MGHRIAAALTLSALVAVMGTTAASEGGSQREPDRPGRESAERDRSTSSFYSGSEFRGLSDRMRLTYIAALVEGMTFSGHAIGSELLDRLTASKARDLMSPFERVDRFASQMRLDQLSDTVDGYLSDHPAQRHQPMFNLVWAALREACELQHEN